MQKDIEQLYRNKLHSIEEKFHIISQAYTKLSLELDKKNQIINDLNQIIHILQINVQQNNSKLHEANTQIEKLRVQLDKETMIKKVYIGTQNKSKSVLPPPTSPKLSSVNLALNSQTSITPKILLQKELVEKDQSSQVKQKYENLLKNLSPTSKTSMVTDLNSKYLKINVDNQIQLKKEPMRFNLESQDAKFNDLTNYKFNKQTNQVKQALNTKFQTRPITHSQPAVSALSDIVSKESTMQTLTKIWEERDREIEKMDQLFQSINSKLKQFEQ